MGGGGGGYSIWKGIFDIRDQTISDGFGST